MVIAILFVLVAVLLVKLEERKARNDALEYWGQLPYEDAPPISSIDPDFLVGCSGTVAGYWEELEYTPTGTVFPALCPHGFENMDECPNCGR